MLALVAASLAVAAGADGATQWRLAGLPYVSGNSTDGLGFGAAGEAFRRPVGDSTGYDLKLTPYWYAATSFQYLTWGVKVEDLRRQTEMFAQFTYRGWSNLRYAGVGGADIAVDHSAEEVGNEMRGPHGFVTLSRPLADGAPWSVFGGVYARIASGEPGRSSLLAEDDPLGVRGGTYSDASLGLAFEQTDRWPLPTCGVRAESSLRVGTFVDGAGWAPAAGLHAEARGWLPLGTERLVVGGRLMGDHTAGQVPFFEKGTVGGRIRDEVGFDRMLSGYGAVRTRGDGVVAAMAELRADLFAVPGLPQFRLMASVYLEQAWLFEGLDPGPPMPSVGVAPELFAWQGIVARPFAAWGWRGEGNDREPAIQLGISMREPL